MLYYDNLSLDTLEGEIWLPAIGYEGLYEVSSLGRVKSVKRKDSKMSKFKQMIMRQLINDCGYLFVNLWGHDGNDKHNRVHRLVCMAFIPNPENKKDVNHKKGVKIDNRVTELEWNTRGENHKHAYANGLRVAFFLGKKGELSANAKPVSQFTKDGIYINTFTSGVQAGEKLGIGYKHICSVCKGERKTTGGYIWKYA